MTPVLGAVQPISNRVLLLLSNPACGRSKTVPGAQLIPVPGSVSVLAVVFSPIPATPAPTYHSTSSANFLAETSPPQRVGTLGVVRQLKESDRVTIAGVHPVGPRVGATVVDEGESVGQRVNLPKLQHASGDLRRAVIALRVGQC